jgi:hypothetical protein
MLITLTQHIDSCFRFSGWGNDEIIVICSEP